MSESDFFSVSFVNNSNNKFKGMAEHSDNNIHDAFLTIEKFLGGKHIIEINAIKMKMLKLEHKVSEQQRDITILKLENEMKLLKLKYNNEVEEKEKEATPLKNEKEMKPVKNYSKMSTDDLLTDGIEKYFLRENEIQNSYQEWFEIVTTRLTKNNPLIFETFLLEKLNSMRMRKIRIFATK